MPNKEVSLVGFALPKLGVAVKVKVKVKVQYDPEYMDFDVSSKPLTCVFSLN